MPEQNNVVRTIVHRKTAVRYPADIDKLPYKYLTKWSFIGSFLFTSIMAWIVTGDGELSLLAGIGVGAAVTFVAVNIFLHHAIHLVYYPSETTEENELAQPRQIESNRGPVLMRPDIPYMLTDGNESMPLPKPLLDAMERLYRQRENSKGQQISRDEIGMRSRNDDYNKLVRILIRRGLLSEDKRYTGSGVRWLVYGSYFAEGE